MERSIQDVNERDREREIVAEGGKKKCPSAFHLEAAHQLFISKSLHYPTAVWHVYNPATQDLCVVVHTRAHPGGDLLLHLHFSFPGLRPHVCYSARLCGTLQHLLTCHFQKPIDMMPRLLKKRGVFL